MACPNCMKPLNYQNRLITEDCGHSKCRLCLIAEANGCEKCNQKKINSFETQRSNAIRYEEQNPEPNSSKKILKKQKSKIPSHVVKISGDDNEVFYHCTICDKRFKSRTQQYYHLFCNNTSKKPFKCDKCFKTFSTSAHLKYHEAEHLKQSFQCSLCEKSFSKIQILQKHQRLHNRVTEQCQECGVKLRNKEALDAHLKRHQNILPFECDKCDKKFSLQTSLRMHQKVVHIANKKFKCDVCGKVFNRNSSLKVHSISHSSRREYSCPKCSKYFNNKKSLLRHSKIHNIKSKFKCILCDTSSIRKDNILRHIRNMHPNQNKSCMQEVSGESEDSEGENSDDNMPSKDLAIEAPNTNAIELENVRSDIPKTIANSSVIRCIGNVKPVTIIEQDQVTEKSTQPTPSTTNLSTITTMHKKLKKAYDPHEIYRKILGDDDSNQENEIETNIHHEEPTTAANEQIKQVAQESNVICHGQQSNFSETHWRKNFKHNYQIQFD